MNYTSRFNSVLLLFFVLNLTVKSLDAQHPVINELMSSNLNTLEDEDGDSPDWIELFNAGTDTVQLEGFGLSDDPADPYKWIFTEWALNPQEYLLVFASGKNRTIPSNLTTVIVPGRSGHTGLTHLPDPKFHTNFKIKSSGELITLTHPSGLLIDSVQTGNLPADISLGRKDNGTDTWRYFLEPTPEQSNSTTGYRGFTGNVGISAPGGFYSGVIEVILSKENPEDVIHYTLSGNEPTEQSPVYTNPLFISGTTVVRATAFREGYIPVRIATASYFFSSGHSLPVVSLITDPVNLFDPNTGIYHENNIFKDWEKPVHIEFWEPDGTPGFSIDAGIKLFGNYSRIFPQKSFALTAREEYGFEEIEYPVFEDLPFETYHSLVLRNSGNDWLITMFRDGLMTGLVAGDGLDVQAFRPSVVYLNGQYWGIYNLREKVNDWYIESHHGTDHDSIDMLEMNGLPVYGDTTEYDNMLSFIHSHSLTDQTNYEYIETQIDIENFITYEIAEIFINNTDWPANNIKYWRPASGGKWKWILFDTDFGFGLVNDASFNTLAYATDPNGNEANNPPWSTFLLRELLTNSEFRTSFINRYADLLNSSFQTDRIIGQINHKKAAILDEMPLQFAKWGSNIQEWESNIAVLRTFANGRRAYAQSHVLQYFSLPGIAQVSLNVAPVPSGSIKISTLTVTDFPWTGEYFNGVPVTIVAQPSPGYRFVGWEGSITSNDPQISLVFSGDAGLTALFEPYSPDSLVINEINYNSADDFNPEDWIEFYNPMDQPVDMTGWYFKDEDNAHIFNFPEGLIVASHDYLVLCFDTTAFHSFFPDVTCAIGNNGFGLSGGGDQLRLFDPSGLLIDSVFYDDDLPWPIEADGQGPTLELIDPSYNNALAENWEASELHGSPGVTNGIPTQLNESNPFETEIQVVPNPFGKTVTFVFHSPVEQAIDITIFNHMGELFMQFKNVNLPLGTGLYTWDGRDISGKPVPPGLYLCRISSRDFSTTVKLIKGE